MESKKTLQDLQDELDILNDELIGIQEDIKNARKTGDHLGEVYKSYNRCVDRIDHARRQMRECHPAAEKPKVLTDTQSVISFASVQRKTPFALVKTQASLDTFRTKK